MTIEALEAADDSAPSLAERSGAGYFGHAAVLRPATAAASENIFSIQKSQTEERLAVALDFPTAHQALDFTDRLEGTCRWMKVGLQLFCAAGPSLIDTLRARGFSVFLDLKLHDIPNTVAGAIRSVATTGASLLTVHASGGEAMLSAAAEAAAAAPGSPRLLAVTVLTSMDAHQLAGIGLPEPPEAQVLRLAELATRCGIPGLVCSAQETAMLRHHLGPAPLLVVPGIRLPGTGHADQRRVATPHLAIASGASMLVIGRPITQAPHPAQAARAILAEIAAATRIAGAAK